MEFAHFDFVPLEPRGIFAGEAIKEGARHLTHFHKQYCAFNPTAALIPATGDRIFICRDLLIAMLMQCPEHLPFNVLSVFIPSWRWGVGATQHCLQFDNSSQALRSLMKAAPTLQMHPHSTEASRHHSSNNRWMHLYRWVQVNLGLGLIASEVPAGWKLNKLFYSSTEPK